MLLGLALALIAAIQRADLVVVVGATLAGPALVALLNFGMLFGRQRPHLRPHRKAVTAATSIRVVRSGGLFLVLGFAVAVGYESDLLVLFASFAVISPHVDWAGLLNVAEASRASVRPAVTALAAAICVSMPLGVSQRVHLAYQEGFLSSL